MLYGHEQKRMVAKMVVKCYFINNCLIQTPIPKVLRFYTQSLFIGFVGRFYMINI